MAGMSESLTTSMMKRSSLLPVACAMAWWKATSAGRIPRRMSALEGLERRLYGREILLGGALRRELRRCGRGKAGHDLAEPEDAEPDEPCHFCSIWLAVVSDGALTKTPPFGPRLDRTSFLAARILKPANRQLRDVEAPRDLGLRGRALGNAQRPYVSCCSAVAIWCADSASPESPV